MQTCEAWQGIIESLRSVAVFQSHSSDLVDCRRPIFLGIYVFFWKPAVLQGFMAIVVWQTKKQLIKGKQTNYICYYWDDVFFANNLQQVHTWQKSCVNTADMNDTYGPGVLPWPHVFNFFHFLHQSVQKKPWMALSKTGNTCSDVPTFFLQFCIWCFQGAGSSWSRRAEA